jgi:hypothetical protein
MNAHHEMSNVECRISNDERLQERPGASPRSKFIIRCSLFDIFGRLFPFGSAWAI